MIDRPSAYVPPPPPGAPRRGASPWVYVGVGCLVVLLLTIAAAGFGIYRFMQVFGGPPPPKQEALKALGDVPVYPGAQYDADMTKIASATASVLRITLGGKTVVGVAFHMPASPAKSLAWYDEQLAAKKYKVIHTRQNTANAAQGQEQHQYFRPGEAVVVMAQPAPEDRTGTGPAGDASMTMVVRISGIRRTPAMAESPAD